jgi:hypothetical protein
LPRPEADKSVDLSAARFQKHKALHSPFPKKIFENLRKSKTLIEIIYLQ